MKKVLALIEQKKSEFAKLPLFEFMRDPSIDPQKRLAWAPCAAPFIMSFGELNRDVLREEPTNNKIQLAINKHTYEDDYHWMWFLEDLEKLGFDRSINFTDALRFLWSEETQASRWLAYQLYRYTFQASPLQKLIVVEVIEATGNVFLAVATQVNQELKAITQKEYRYFGGEHFTIDSAHSLLNSLELEELIEDICLTETTLQEAYDLVNQVFELFTKFTHRLLAYAQAQQIKQPSLVA